MASRCAAALLVALGAVACSAGANRDVDPRPQPDGDQLVFSGGLDGYVYTVRADGSGLRRLTRGREWRAQGVAWAPDRSRIAFITENVRRGSSAVVVMRADGTDRRRLANLSDRADAVRWRGGNEIEVLHWTWREQRFAVFAVPAIGGPLRRRGTERRGAVSPSGTRLAFARGTPSGDMQIYVGEPDGSGAWNVSRTRSVGPSHVADTSPAWSPYGSRLAFLRDRGDGRDVYVMSADGTNQRRLSRGARVDRGPEWSPDGRRIAFVGDPDDDGRHELLVVPAHGGTPTVAASSEYITAFAWGSHVHRRLRAPSLERPAERPYSNVRTVSLALAEGRARIVDRRPALPVRLD